MTEQKPTKHGDVPIPQKWVWVGLAVLAGVTALVALAAPEWEGGVAALLVLLALASLPVLLLTLFDRARARELAASEGETKSGYQPTGVPVVAPQTASGTTVVYAVKDRRDHEDLGGCLVLMVLAIAIGGFFAYRNHVYQWPVPSVLDISLVDRPGFDFAWVANVKVRNYGAAGKVRVVADLKYGSFWTKHKVVEMATGETKVVKIVFSEPTLFFDGGLQASCEAYAKPEWHFEEDKKK